jgi:hypothetical protein
MVDFLEILSAQRKILMNKTTQRTAIECTTEPMQNGL